MGWQSIQPFPCQGGLLPGLDAVPAHGLPCLRMCGGALLPISQSKRPFWLWGLIGFWITYRPPQARELDVSQAMG